MCSPGGMNGEGGTTDDSGPDDLLDVELGDGVTTRTYRALLGWELTGPHPVYVLDPEGPSK